jgi:hypothetical protein
MNKTLINSKHLFLTTLDKSDHKCYKDLTGSHYFFMNDKVAFATNGFHVVVADKISRKMKVVNRKRKELLVYTYRTFMSRYLYKLIIHDKDDIMSRYDAMNRSGGSYDLPDLTERQYKIVDTYYKVRYPQGWNYYPGDVCCHGVYVGGCGIDWMCGPCEDGEGTWIEEVMPRTTSLVSFISKMLFRY